MKLFRLRFFIVSTLLCFGFNSKAQGKQNIVSATEVSSPPSKSRILKSADSPSALVRVELEGAQYDPSKKYLPYFLISYITQKNQNAQPGLVIKSTKLVEEKHASVLKKYYLNQISNDFEIVSQPGISKNENYNHHRLTPFRLTKSGEIEELIDYTINWQVSEEPQLIASRGSSNFKTTSVLATGNWYKIGITKTGIYKLDRNFFSDMGINVNSINPKKIRVYGNGGKMLAERNKDFRYDDLEETAIYVVGEEDNKFDNGDYALFYGTGTSHWARTGSINNLRFNATSSLYSDTSFYFITVDLGDGKRMNTLPAASQPHNVTATTYDYYNFHELNVVNFGKTGREFYGEYFDITTSYSFKWDDGNFVTGGPVYSEVSAVARYSDSVKFAVNCGTSYYVLATRPLYLNNTHEDYAAPAVRTGSGVLTSPAEINLTVSKITPKSIGWLNKVVVNARRQLMLNSKQFSFRDLETTAPGNVCKYSINFLGNPGAIVLNVSNPINPALQNYVVGNGAIDFVAPSDTLNEYCIAPQSDFFTPSYTGKVPNQNLHALQQADYVIITHPLFVREAQRLGAFHQQQDGLSYVVASIDQIYNEFSSGKQDPSAIRDFIRMLYSRNLPSGKQVKYVCLMGDGSFNNKNRNLLNNSNLIPTYQSLDALSETQSVASDDFYGMMDDNEGYNVEYSGLVDIGVGRFVGRTSSEINVILDKITNYYRKDAGLSGKNDGQSQATMGDWRNWLLFLGDDEDGAEHMKQADDLSRIVNLYAPTSNVDKIFLDAYQRYSTPGGFRYPDAANDFLKRIRRGALIFNYTGHGGEVGLTAERMIDVDIINSLDNYNKLPLFITATCEFSRYDDPARTSAGELCLLNPKGGAISLFTTCRLAFSNTNFNLNSVLLKHMFKKMPDGSRPRLGDILRKTKAETGQSLLANFHLLGDPALTLAYPEYKVMTSSINKKLVSTNSSDTLSALSKINISGYVADTLGNKISNFNGVVYPTVFDREQEVTSLMNSETSAINYGIQGQDDLLPFKFDLQRNILYRGKIQVTNGDFSFDFMVPKDISFVPGPGRVSYYATNGVTDANGNYSRLVVGGASKNGVTDNEGPKIELYLNDKSFVNGSVTNEKPIMFASLSDSSGINTVGTGIGHDIAIILDQNTSKPINLNDYYEADLNSYQSGKIRYPFNELSEGNHTLSFKAWDIQNNSTTSNLDFVVAPSEEVALEQVLNYPNPFTNHTQFMFQHNQGCNPLKVVVQVYTVSGKVVKTLQKSVRCDENGSQSVDWDGKDEYGDKLARGVYIYKLSISDSESKKAEKIEKLVILN